MVKIGKGNESEGLTEAYVAQGIQRIVNEDGSAMLIDSSSGITEMHFGPQFTGRPKGGCPYCGSYAIAAHQIWGIVAGDQDFERVCMDCGKPIN